MGDALSFGWAKFQANIGSIVLSALVLLVGVGLVAVLGFFAGLVLQAVLAAVLLVVFQVIAADLIRAALTVIDGGSWEFSEVLRTDKIGKVVVTALIVGAITVVGTLLCYFPGLIAGFMLSYSLYFVVDRDLEPMAAVKASVELTKNNLGNTLVWYIVGAIVAFAGFLACGVGALVSLPVVLLGTAYSYGISPAARWCAEPRSGRAQARRPTRARPFLRPQHPPLAVRDPSHPGVKQGWAARPRGKERVKDAGVHWRRLAAHPPPEGST